MEKKTINLELPEELSLFTVDEYRNKVIDKIGDKKIGKLDAVNLRLLDGAGIQFLLSLHKSFPYLFIENLSMELNQNLELMGVKEILTQDGSVSDE